MGKAYNAKHRETDFKVGQQVYLNVGHYNTQRPSKKLDNPRAGPFKVLRKIGNSYEF